MNLSSPPDGIGFAPAGDALDSAQSSEADPESDLDMSDLYQERADTIADELLGAPELFDDVSKDFAANSDEGYGQWMADAEDTDDTSGSAEFDAPEHSYDGLERRDRALTDDEKSDLDELDRVMSGGSNQSLLASSGRGEYVHQDDAEPAVVDTEQVPASVIPTGTLPGLSHRPWWHFAWFKRNLLSHRIAAIAAAVIIVIIIVGLFLPDGHDDSASTTTTTPAYSVPTMTQSAIPSAEPGSAAPGADGPVGIKRADTRCTAGSTDPMQAFDKDTNTAWMCLPAYGVPGTVLRVEFDNWYVVTSVCIVPGWLRVNADGSDEWVKHLTAQVAEYQFNDPDETRLTQETNNIHDEVCTPIQPPVLASAMTITIREFGTPTGAVANTTTIPGQGGIITSDTPKTGDLKDFAISEIAITGHRAH